MGKIGLISKEILEIRDAGYRIKGPIGDVQRP
jgi:hypothetical protein